MPPRKRARGAEAPASAAAAAEVKTVLVETEERTALSAKLAAFRRQGKLTDVVVRAKQHEQEFPAHRNCLLYTSPSPRDS